VQDVRQQFEELVEQEQVDHSECALGLRPSSRLRVSVNGALCIVQIGFTRIGISGEIVNQILVRPTS